MTEPRGDRGLSKAERREKYRENQNYFSQTLSEQTRYVGFGFVAFSYGLLSSDSAFARATIEDARGPITTALLCGCLVLLTDFLHLSLGWWSNTLAAENHDDEYRMTPGARKLRGVQLAMFYAKQVLALAGCLLIIYAASRSVL